MGEKRYKTSTIFIIDDDERILSSLQMQLKNGYESVVSNCSYEALKKLEENFSPDLILCDIMMPEMNGFEFVERVRKIEKFRHTPIIFITGIYDDSYRIKGLELGALDYITKPFRKGELLLKIKNILDMQEKYKTHIIENAINHSRNEILMKFFVQMNLSKREIEVAIMVTSLYSSIVISEKLKLSIRTVEHHLQSIYRKLSINSRKELMLLVNSL